MADIRGEIDELWKKVERLEKQLKLLSEAVDGKFKEAVRYSIACSSAITAQMTVSIVFAEKLGAMKAGQREEKLMEFLKKAKEDHVRYSNHLNVPIKTLQNLFQKYTFRPFLFFPSSGCGVK